jgi:hypothetical protein
MKLQLIVISLGIANVIVGLLVRAIARPFSKLAIWWQEKWLQLPAMKPLSEFFERNEGNMTYMARVIGVSFVVMGAGTILVALAWLLIEALAGPL